jgi:hypothetical protein
MRFVGPIRALFLLSLAAGVAILSCSSDSPSEPAKTGALALGVAYQGTLGVVDAQHPIRACLYEGSNPDAQGTPDLFQIVPASPDTVRFADLATGSYTLVVLFDVGGDSLQQLCPYEVYRDKAFGVTPDPVTIQAGGTTELQVAFNDAHLRNPWQPMPAFVLPDSNPGSPTYRSRLRLQDLQGQRSIVYFAEAGSEALPEFALQDINPDSPTQGQVLAFSSWRNHRILLYFGVIT